VEIRRRRLTLPPTVLPLCFLALACAPASLQKPTARFESASVGEVTPQGFRVNFGVALTNPNAFAVPLTSADYKLSLGGQQVIDDSYKAKESIPANGTARMTLPVTLSFEKLLAAEESIRHGGGDVPFTIGGNLAFGAGNSSIPLLGSGGGVRVPFEYSGTLPLRSVLSDPTVLLRSPAARELAQRLFGSLLSR
jgi:LEA14-like dessication related protein